MRDSSDFSLNPKHNDTSFMLDLIRWTSAQMVCVGHAFSLFDIAKSYRAPYFPEIQNIGVLIFFVVSGFLIAYTLANGAQKGTSETFTTYLIKRFTRVYSAFLPCLLIIALLDYINIHFNGNREDFFFSFESFFGTLLFFNNYSGPFYETLRVWSCPSKTDRLASSV